jgi:thymidine phosphorylase
MLPQEIIRKKRDGVELSDAEIAFVAQGLTNGALSEGQIAAFAMAVYFRGMGTRERIRFMLGLRDSGEVLRWDGLNGPVLDKHSTGGVGDNVSLMLAPAIAALGGYVPMISGRGLGHTGGTLDKLESIPGYDTRPDTARLARVVREVGVAIVGQTASLAPADGRLYAVRDITATVESKDLICASILSKKLAAGLSGLVLDVKCGSGAFMREPGQARELAQVLGSAANGAGLRTSVLLTDMDAPLASAAGNALEVMNSVHFLTGRQQDPRLFEVVLALGAELLLVGGLVADLEEARGRLQRCYASGQAAERFARMVAALGGPADLLQQPQVHLSAAPLQREVFANDEGHVLGVDCRAVGLAVVGLGGGRVRASDPIDPAVGFSRLAPLGARVDRQRPLGVVHARDEGQAASAAQALRAAYRVGPAAPEGAAGPVVIERQPCGSFARAG